MVRWIGGRQLAAGPAVASRIGAALFRLGADFGCPITAGRHPPVRELEVQVWDKRASIVLPIACIGLVASTVAHTANYLEIARPIYPTYSGAVGELGNPLDDSFDPPYGYGEYAEYGPWAPRYYDAGCRVIVRRMRTPYGIRAMVLPNGC